MSNLKRDITTIHPEQRSLIDVFVKAAYRNSYSDVFRTFVDYCLHEYTAPKSLTTVNNEFKFPSSYNETEQTHFKTMLREVQNLCFKYSSFWNGVKNWYDPFGTLFENVIANSSRQNSGQFFTPPAICDIMAQMTIEKPTPENVGCTVVDPCCGSGRLLLASNSINPGLYHIANDIDPLCAKMTAINFCLNGTIGEITCNDGLMSTERNFRFGFRIVPLMALFNDPMAQMMFLINPMYKKQYCVIDLDFEQSMIKMAEPSKKTFFVEHVQTHVEHRNEIHPEGLQGMLFDTGEELKKGVKPKPTKHDNSTIKPKKSIDDKLNLLFSI